jgi:hypothetical protein
MSQPTKGTQLKLSPARRLMIEMLRHARRIPSIPVARTLQIGATAEARARAVPTPSWTAIFIRAYGLVARRHPELRRTFIRLPWPHLYEHPTSVCAVGVEREWQGETILLGGKLRAPEEMSLEQIHRHLRYLKETPVWQVSDFRQVLRLGRMPGLLRRFLFWQTLYISGFKRAKRFGTFMVSSYGSLGAEQLHPLSTHTSLLTFGPISDKGSVVAKIIYDHRVLDGRCVGHCLADLEQVLRTEILAEILSLAGTQSAA